jgi:sugar/nucleoside kinase (ribokinase family)
MRKQEDSVQSALFVGLATVDVIYATESTPRGNEKIVAQQQEIVCGGPAANAAITCAFLGCRATLVSAVGGHPLASVIHDELKAHRVSLVDLDPESTEMPVVASILVAEGSGNRSVISGYATRTIVAGDACGESVLGDAAVVMVDGHQMNCAIRAAAQAKQRGIPVVLDGGSWKPRTDELLATTNIAICSQDFRPPGTVDVQGVIDYVRQRGVEAVAITRGAKPILWSNQKESGEVDIAGVKAVDTLAAGDIFHGAFCYQMAMGTTFLSALESAAEVASYSCRFFGPRLWMQSWARRG